MWRDELSQGFRTSDRRQIIAWQGGYPVLLCDRSQRRGTLSFIGIVLTVAISLANKTPAVAAILSHWQFESTDSHLEITSQQVSLQQFESVEARTRWLLRPLIVQMPTTDQPTSPDILPPANLPINQGGVVKVPPVNRPEAILPITATPPALLPPTSLPTSLTPTPLTTSKPLEGSFRRLSPAINPVPVLEFGQPLPKITPAKTDSLKRFWF